jgi:hypothetical protein
MLGETKLEREPPDPFADHLLSSTEDDDETGLRREPAADAGPDRSPA